MPIIKDNRNKIKLAKKRKEATRNLLRLYKRVEQLEIELQKLKAEKGSK